MRGPARLGRGIRADDGHAVDLGNEPPLVIGERVDEHPAVRSVSLRWLAGTVLTGFTSVFLMGGALMAALSNPSHLATIPGIDVSDKREGVTPPIAFGKKGDRIAPLEEAVSSRQILKFSMVSKQDGRDFIKERPFAKITATLATRKPEHAAEIPEFDVLRIFADTTTEEATAAAGVATPADDEFYGAKVEGEVVVKMSDFPVGDGGADSAVGYATDEAEAMVRAQASFADGETQVAALPFVDPTRFSDDDSEGDPFSALGVRIIPENVSSVVKSDVAEEEEPLPEDRLVAVAKGKSFRSLLQENDIAGDDADEIVAALSELVDLNRLHVGQKLRIAFAPAIDEESRPLPIKVSVYDDGAHQATVARTDSNAFVRADEPTSSPEEFAAEEAGAGSGDFAGVPRLYDAVYETALEQEVPKPLIDDLIRIFAYDVDFQSRVTPGDSIEIFHSMPQEEADAAAPEVLFASLKVNGAVKRFYRFRTADDGVVDYYDEEGKSSKKFLMRKPVTSGILRSVFGMRRHPILGYRRMHTGVDYAAPRGTPILAAGNGVVEKAGRSSGYGNEIVLRHTNGYQTLYAHQSAFAKGIAPGVKVRQGQIIGYVGSTGLSTGPHLHFEIRVNNSPVDPLRVRLPRGRVLDGSLLAAFQTERQRIDALLGNEATPPTKVAAATE